VIGLPSLSVALKVRAVVWFSATETVELLVNVGAWMIPLSFRVVSK